MSISLYMDVHVPAPITRALTSRGVDVKTAQEDGTTELEDNKLLDRATALNRVLFTRDEDLLPVAVAGALMLDAHTWATACPLAEFWLPKTP